MFMEMAEAGNEWRRFGITGESGIFDADSGVRGMDGK